MLKTPVLLDAKLGFLDSLNICSADNTAQSHGHRRNHDTAKDYGHPTWFSLFLWWSAACPRRHRYTELPQYRWHSELPLHRPGGSVLCYGQGEVTGSVPLSIEVKSYFNSVPEQQYPSDNFRNHRKNGILDITIFSSTMKLGESSYGLTNPISNPTS